MLKHDRKSHRKTGECVHIANLAVDSHGRQKLLEDAIIGGAIQRIHKLEDVAQQRRDSTLASITHWAIQRIYERRDDDDNFTEPN